MRRLWETLLGSGAYDGEPPEQRGRRRIIVAALWISLPGITYSAIAAPGAWTAAMDVAKAAGHLGALLALRVIPRRIVPVINAAFGIGLVADVTASILTGGLYPSGLHVLWSLISVLGALVIFTVRVAVVWFVLFVAGLGLVVSSPAWTDPLYELGEPATRGATVIVGVTFFVFLALAYFVRQRNRFQRESDELLHNILPDEIAERLKRDGGMIADHFDDVSVLFVDVVGFTPLSSGMPPRRLVGLLNSIFSDLDEFVDEAGLEKIKTVGDEYMVASGVPTPRSDHAHAAALLALRIRDHFRVTKFDGNRIDVRIGINSGPVVAGIIGRRKFSYDLWGDVVNTASRMESHGIPGEIQISPSTFEHIRDEYRCEPRGRIEIKGKGDLETWLLVGRRAEEWSATT